VPDIEVGDGSDDSFRIHEADLAGHLSNPKDAKLKNGGDEKPAEVLSKEKEEALSKAKEEKFAEPKGPIEPASKDDFQFVQAMNLLKGLPVEAKPKEKVKADIEKTDKK